MLAAYVFGQRNGFYNRCWPETGIYPGYRFEHQQEGNAGKSLEQKEIDARLQAQWQPSAFGQGLEGGNSQEYFGIKEWNENGAQNEVERHLEHGDASRGSGQVPRQRQQDETRPICEPKMYIVTWSKA